MKKHVVTLALLLVFGAVVVLAQRTTRATPDDGLAKGAADIVFTNGRIYTVSKTHPFAEAVAVRDGKFLEVGSARDVAACVAERTRVVDLGGALKDRWRA